MRYIVLKIIALRFGAVAQHDRTWSPVMISTLRGGNPSGTKEGKQLYSQNLEGNDGSLEVSSSGYVLQAYEHDGIIPRTVATDIDLQHGQQRLFVGYSPLIIKSAQIHRTARTEERTTAGNALVARCAFSGPDRKMRMANSAMSDLQSEAYMVVSLRHTWAVESTQI
ncbi:hypothetical protein BS50DRAFT_88687 [Corynespora cassiicola Philippines]|uniref:Uncharacterized protein n=1 Tax=Corynespora cassiicola Philippines TaxID=1448308 RepID=A0A2T2NEC1_CORCC|nr:hypothetical protein BS50DRAFT_88687 [Corynespora cassiicola Philippines]